MAERAAPTDDTAERTRRRFQRRQWRRRWLAWRYVVAAVLLVAAFAGGLYAVYFSTWLSIQGVEVTGTSYVSADEVAARADVPTGEPLATVDLRAIQARVQAIRGVASADVTRQWPDHVLIEVEERVPVVVIREGRTISGVDVTGELVRDYADQPDDLPLMDVAQDAGQETRALGAEVAAGLPDDLRERVVRLDVAGADEIRLVLEDQRIVIWGRADQADLKAEVLEALLSQKAKVYDVSVPSRPTTSDRLPDEIS